MTTDNEVLAALEGCRVVSYQTLLDRLRGQGVEPLGMLIVLRNLECEGRIRQTNRQGTRWLGHGDDRGPLYIHVLG